MVVEIKVPTPGESITEVEIGKWIVSDGDLVAKGQELGEIESDKATLTLSASESGKIKILISEGDRVAVGLIACTIDTSFAPAEMPTQAKAVAEPKAEIKQTLVSDPVKEKLVQTSAIQEESKIKVTLVAQKMMEENHLSMEEVLSGLHRISKSDIEAVLALPIQDKQVSSAKSAAFSRAEKRDKITSLRRKLAERFSEERNRHAHHL